MGSAFTYQGQLNRDGNPVSDACTMAFSLYDAPTARNLLFKIARGVPAKKVSWEVTALRNDPYLRDHPVHAEVDKPAVERGTYLYPEGYGQPHELGYDYRFGPDRPAAASPEADVPTGGNPEEVP